MGEPPEAAAGGGVRRDPARRPDPAEPAGRRLTTKELWTLPGGGLDHGEDPRDAVVREVHEETGLDVQVGETARVYSAHQPDTWRHGRRATPTRCGSSTTAGCRWTPGAAGGGGGRLDGGGGVAAGGRRPRRHGARARWSPRRSPTIGRTSCSGSRRTR